MDGDGGLISGDPGALISSRWRGEPDPLADISLRTSGHLTHLLTSLKLAIIGANTEGIDRVGK